MRLSLRKTARGSDARRLVLEMGTYLFGLFLPIFIIHLALGSDWLFTHSMGAYRHRVQCQELIHWLASAQHDLITRVTAHCVEDHGAVAGQRVVTGYTGLTPKPMDIILSGATGSTRESHKVGQTVTLIGMPPSDVSSVIIRQLVGL